MPDRRRIYRAGVSVPESGEAADYALGSVMAPQ